MVRSFPKVSGVGGLQTKINAEGGHSYSEISILNLNDQHMSQPCLSSDSFASGHHDILQIAFKCRNTCRYYPVSSRICRTGRATLRPPRRSHATPPTHSFTPPTCHR